MEDNGWAEHKIYINKTLEDIKDVQKESRKDVADIKTRLKVVEIKSGFWGAMSGAITALGLSMTGFTWK